MVPPALTLYQPPEEESTSTAVPSLSVFSTRLSEELLLRMLSELAVIVPFQAFALSRGITQTAKISRRHDFHLFVVLTSLLTAFLPKFYFEIVKKSSRIRNFLEKILTFLHKFICFRTKTGIDRQLFLW